VPHPAAAAIGDEITLGIRPEHVRFADGGGLPATVDLVEQMGGESYVYLTLASGERIVARAPGQSRLRVGEAVAAEIGEGAHLFRRGDGEVAIIG
jgi:multiple sugar transport system ATP-binding protein